MKIYQSFLAAGLLLLVACSSDTPPPRTDDIDQTNANILNGLFSVNNVKEKLEQRGFSWGAPVFVRIFKEENILEVWVKRDDGKFALFQKYPICTYSGGLGPKKRQGDKQAPEGFYAFGLRHLNPRSQYHLSFNLNYPNAYDKAHGYTGNYLMVHGDCVSVGCYAMGNRQIEEIYTLVGSALQRGQPFVRVHAFPFHLTEENLAQHKNSPHHGFWQMLKPGYDAFERNHVPPEIDVIDGRYAVRVKDTPSTEKTASLLFAKQTKSVAGKTDEGISNIASETTEILDDEAALFANHITTPNNVVTEETPAQKTTVVEDAATVVSTEALPVGQLFLNVKEVASTDTEVSVDEKMERFIDAVIAPLDETATPVGDVDDLLPH